MTKASERARQAVKELLQDRPRTRFGAPYPSGNVSDGWIFSYTAEDGQEYHVEVCCAWLSEEELDEEDT